jgi:hypothetical protein
MFIRRLKESGISETQAEAISEAFRDATGEVELATQRDLGLLKQALRVDIARVELKLIEYDGDFKTIQWMLGIVVGGVIASVLRQFLPA